MRVLIIGAGLIGVTSAWLLHRQGHEVVVVDRREGPGLETSYANGGMITPSMSDPWNAPGCWRTLLASIGRSGSAMQLRLRAVPELAGWGLRFLRNATPARFARSSASNLRLALFSLQVMEAIRQETAIEYSRDRRGSLRVFRDPASFDSALEMAERLKAEGLGFRGLSPDETALLEPALLPISNRLAGAIHYPDDETGDAHRFSAELAAQAERAGVEFRYGAEVSDFRLQNGALRGVLVGGDWVTADRYIVAAASHSPRLLANIGISIPVRPVKGYSVTLEERGATLSFPIVDDSLHAVITPLDSRLRVAGTAEFAGYDLSSNPARTANLIDLLKRVLPELDIDFPSAESWCGLRATSADGVPFIGPTSIANLMVNTGHGHLGWTLAAGSGQLIADLISGRPTAIPSEPYAVGRRV